MLRSSTHVRSNCAQAENIACALNIMRRMPPSNIEDNLSGLLNIIPDATDELLQRVDQPLEVATDPSNGRKYLLCDYNRDGDSYRYGAVRAARAVAEPNKSADRRGRTNTTHLSTTEKGLRRRPSCVSLRRK